MADRSAVARLLLATDEDYFAAAAEEVHFPGGRLLRMPGLEQVPAGCVAVPETVTAAFLAEASERASEAGASLLRFYTPMGDPVPQGSGLHSSIEHGYILAASARTNDFLSSGTAAAKVRPVRGEDDWRRKLELATALEQLPDGKQAAAAAWTELERRKCDAGYMAAYLIEIDGEAVGAFALARRGDLLRLKNLLVHPAFRSRGLARAAVRHAVAHARDNGFEWVGAFAIAEGAGQKLYERCGFAAVTGQVEWSRPLARQAASPSA